MEIIPEDLELRGEALGAVLRAVRKLRGTPQTEIAKTLGLSRRRYLDLEAGKGRLAIDRFVAFADITKSDRVALLAAVLWNKPKVAIYCADNKLMWLMAIAADDFADVVGEQMSALRPLELMSAFRTVFDKLAADLAERSAAEQALLRRPGRPPPTEADD